MTHSQTPPHRQHADRSIATDEFPKHLDLKSDPITCDRTDALLGIFPEVETEAGHVDIDRLKLALGEAVDVGRERYGMTWPGKADCFKTIQTPSIATLVPETGESVHFETTDNVIIEGDNLEALKLLQKSYTGKIKAIYIDPPYNTGHDFVYTDNFDEPLHAYLELTGQVDADGKRMHTNADSSGRFHSNWLNMMYPRLYLARNLLRDDGVIFISIDDNEVTNLRKICDEVFGEENFVVQMVWENREGGGGSDSRTFKTKHEYVLCFARAVEQFETIGETVADDADYGHEDESVATRGRHKLIKLNSFSIQYSASLDYPIETPDGTKILPGDDKRRGCWRWSRQKVTWGIANGFIVFRRSPRTEEWTVYTKQYFRVDNEDKATVRRLPPSSVIAEYSSTMASKQLDALFGQTKVFDYSKPHPLIQRVLSFASPAGADDLILDFFAGSGTTAQAVLELNAKDGGNRKFILVQLPEPTDRKDYPTIADVTKERVRRVIAKLGTDDGFRVFKLAESNFTTWEAGAVQDADGLARQLQLHVDHIRPGRKDDDLLYEILLKSGYTLTVPVERLALGGAAVHSIDGGKLLVCLERALTIDAIRAMAECNPERVVCLDAGFFDNDQLKTNAVQIFKTKGVPSFKTV
jgi:adenine-specific DNA-methyltransferase